MQKLPNEREFRLVRSHGDIRLGALLRTNPDSVFRVSADLLCLSRSGADYAKQDTPITFR
jgi:hypothetical protein